MIKKNILIKNFRGLIEQKKNITNKPQKSYFW